MDETRPTLTLDHLFHLANFTPNPEEERSIRYALIAHLYGLTRDDFAHILTTFPLVFPDTDAGHAKKQALLATYDRFAGQVRDWPRK